MDTVKKRWKITEVPKTYSAMGCTVAGRRSAPEYTTKADQLAVWSGESLKDAIPSDKSTEYETAWEAYQPGLTADNWESYTEQTSMATAVCAYGAAISMFEKRCQPEAYRTGI